MTLTDLAKLLHDWPDASPSWVAVGQWLAEIRNPTVQSICCRLARLRASAPDFSQGEDGSFTLRWYHGQLGLVTVVVAGEHATVEIAPEIAAGRTEVLKWQ